MYNIFHITYCIYYISIFLDPNLRSLEGEGWSGGTIFRSSCEIAWSHVGPFPWALVGHVPWVPVEPKSNSPHDKKVERTKHLLWYVWSNSCSSSGSITTVCLNLLSCVTSTACTSV